MDLHLILRGGVEIFILIMQRKLGKAEALWRTWPYADIFHASVHVRGYDLPLCYIITELSMPILLS